MKGKPEMVEGLEAFTSFPVPEWVAILGSGRIVWGCLALPSDPLIATQRVPKLQGPL